VGSWRIIVKKAVLDAQRGDARARQWLADLILPADAASTAATTATAAHVDRVATAVAQWLPNREHALAFALEIVRGNVVTG
jgi:hypothetical protein